MAKVRKDNKGRNLRPGETQRADGSYMYVYKLGTKKKYLYDSDLASLRVKEKQINKDKDDGIRTQEAMKLTLNDMFKVYMNNNIKLKPSTRANYLYLWDFYVKEEPFANMPLPQIHRSDILAFYTKLLKHGFAINSLESINTIVHPTLEMAVDDDYIRKNPSKGIYRKLKTDGSAPKPKRRIALTKTQQQNFLRFIAKSPTYSHWLPIMTVLLGTGMRVAECTGITKSDINLSENTISVNHNLIYRVIDGKAGFHITTPKTESGTRIIPILYPEVAEQLRLQIETIDALYPDDQLVLGGVHGFVFRNRTGSFMSAHNINRAIERISVTYNMEEMDQAELEDREPDLLPHFSVHNLRHTFCTRLCESTNDVKFIQQVMGHADFSSTMDIYTHITGDMQRAAAASIDRSIGKAEPREETEPERKGIVDFQPYVGKKRKPGTGCVSELNDHLFEGRYSPIWPDGTQHSRNVYARTREECEEKLKALIAEMNEERKNLKEQLAGIAPPEKLTKKQRKLWDYMRLHPEVTEFSTIAKRTGLARNTVKKHYGVVAAMLGRTMTL